LLVLLSLLSLLFVFATTLPFLLRSSGKTCPGDACAPENAKTPSKAARAAAGAIAGIGLIIVVGSAVRQLLLWLWSA
jgi:hypothetical protein